MPADLHRLIAHGSCLASQWTVPDSLQQTSCLPPGYYLSLELSSRDASPQSEKGESAKSETLGINLVTIRVEKHIDSRVRLPLGVCTFLIDLRSLKRGLGFRARIIKQGKYAIFGRNSRAAHIRRYVNKSGVAPDEILDDRSCAAFFSASWILLIVSS